MRAVVETERLLLRPWKVNDQAEAESLFRYASDTRIGPRCGWRPHMSAAESMGDIANLLAHDGNWAITIKSPDGSGEPVGCIELKPVSRHVINPIEADPELAAQYGESLKNAKELGYWIGRPFWGRGYMPEALNAVLGVAFEELHSSAVWGGHYVENPQSGCVMEKCGMHVVCATRHDYFALIDEYHDDVVRIITKAQWCR
ncbi:MAG: GNAT family N-acetyltransferase [Bifidobacterium sp.]|jgi:RimJ/RimL family protein N-acetyltransferase|nr:GNAT family N-acetyltransferase [Bifidobacterium sp.]